MVVWRRQGDWWFNAVTDSDYDRFWRAHKKYAPQIEAMYAG